MSDQSDRFRAMADAIDLNVGKPFGGAVVIIPPGDDPPIEMLVLDSREDVLQFYSSIKTMAEVAYNRYLQKEQQNKVFGGLR
jgi:hypothetical protein